jgi:hypothetical protein
MQKNMAEVFDSHVRRWAAAWGARDVNAGCDADPVRLLGLLRERLPADVPARFGAALHRKALATQGDRVGLPGGAAHQILTKHNNAAWPCWEMFVHWAEYAAFEATARIYPDLEVLVEDADMDITVRRGGVLVAYSEVKEKGSEARRLVERLLMLEGADIEERLPGTSPPDEIKKANYLLKERPPGPVLFAVRAGGTGGDAVFEKSFEVTVGPGRRLSFSPRSLPLPLLLEQALLHDEHQRAIAELVWQVQRSCPDTWVNRGTKGTYVLYRTVGGTSPILIGSESSGSLYTELPALAPDELTEFEKLLSGHRIELGDTSSRSGHRMWKTFEGQHPVLDRRASAAIAAGLRAVLLAA